MTSHEIRAKFLEFFEKKGHKIVPSAPIVNKDDPTLMFTNAGMNQFKDYFLGDKAAPVPRIADTQKCLRVSGKHNDLEEVGRDGTHHTMFEMLGNWSIGDYFKKEAIAWAWELLTETYKLDKDRLYVSIFEGEKADGLEPDEEAKEYWKEWLPEDRILYFDKKDNFWEMGETGPCGPCSEIHIDLRPDAERKKVDGASLVNVDDSGVVEIWNLVFMQFNRKADRSLESLPEKHIDTGMGFERLCIVLQGKTNTYDTDVFSPTIKYIEQVSGKKYTGKFEEEGKIDIAMRVVADHIRAVAFTIADGQLPANTGAGYVIRRILRRAVRYYYSFLDIKEPFLHSLIPMLSEQFGDVFPELKAQSEQIAKIIKGEEKAFLNTLENGLKRFDQVVTQNSIKNFDSSFRKFLDKEKIEYSLNYQSHKNTPKVDFLFPKDKLAINFLVNRPKDQKLQMVSKLPDVKFDNYLSIDKREILKNTKFGYSFLDNFEIKGIIPGNDAFELYDTFGFPIDLTRLMAEENGWKVDESGFEKALNAQKERGRADAKKEVGDWTTLNDGEVKFVGYDVLSVDNAKVLKHRTVKTKKGSQFQLVLNQTPFYAESGGQRGDKGLLFFGEEKIPVLDTQKENELIIHIVKKFPADLKVAVKAEVNKPKRKATSSNHSAVHLMHAALHDVLGTHALQKGQDVDDNRLRFDFSHFGKMTDEEIAKVEGIVNQKIRENIALQEDRDVPIEEAKKSGAMMLFGEKYGESVRIITFGKEFSTELCGGTHVGATGEIGSFKILAETGVAAGIRRIEAVTSDKAEAYFNGILAEMNALKALFPKSKNIKKDIADLQEENRNLKKQVEKFMLAQAAGLQGELKNKATEINGVKLIAAKVDLGDAGAVKTLTFNLQKDLGEGVVVLGAEISGKPRLFVNVSKSLTESKGLNAGNMVRTLAKEIRGGGGGQPTYAEAGGADASGIENAVKKAAELVG